MNRNTSCARAKAVKVVCCLMVSVMALGAVAVIPAAAGDKRINIQGKLTDSGGVINGSRTMTFKLYPSGNPTAVWGEERTVLLDQGLYNVALGSDGGTAIAGLTYSNLDDVSFNTLYEVGITVSGDSSEMSPRTVIGASGYALGSLGDFNVGQKLLVDSYVGIGTTNPETKLDVRGNISLGSGGNQILTSNDEKFQIVNMMPYKDFGIILRQGSLFPEVLTVKSDSKVGVNTTSPQATLDVSGDVRIGQGRIYAPDGNIRFYTNNGQVAVMWTNGDMTVDKNIWASQNYTTSDRRLKKDIKNLSYSPLSKITKLQAKTYYWNKSEYKKVKKKIRREKKKITRKLTRDEIDKMVRMGISADTINADQEIEEMIDVIVEEELSEDGLPDSMNKKQVGLIAQDLEEQIPEAVSIDKDGYKGIAYNVVTVLLVEAIKEQQGQILSQQAQIDALKAEIKELK